MHQPLIGPDSVSSGGSGIRSTFADNSSGLIVFLGSVFVFDEESLGFGRRRVQSDQVVEVSSYVTDGVEEVLELETRTHEMVVIGSSQVGSRK